MHRVPRLFCCVLLHLLARAVPSRHCAVRLLPLSQAFTTFTSSAPAVDVVPPASASLSETYNIAQFHHLHRDARLDLTSTSLLSFSVPTRYPPRLLTPASCDTLRHPELRPATVRRLRDRSALCASAPLHFCTAAAPSPPRAHRSAALSLSPPPSRPPVRPSLRSTTSPYCRRRVRKSKPGLEPAA